MRAFRGCQLIIWERTRIGRLIECLNTRFCRLGNWAIGYWRMTNSADRQLPIGEWANGQNRVLDY
jgi:hypothetical protein